LKPLGEIVRRFRRLPPLEPRLQSEALSDTEGTRLGRSIEQEAAARPGLSGIHLLADAHQAFAARILLARAAERSLDVQYYIWRGDLSGMLMLEALREAADRGVRVRLLLDDNGIAGLDNVLAALDVHPMIEVRLFNPFFFRHPKALGYLTDFKRLNRRMHNKSFTADCQATIIGGRNIGDEYFAARDGDLFADLDVLAIGAVVSDVSRDFDRYWNCASAWPASRVLPVVGAAQLEELAQRSAAVHADPRAHSYVETVRSLPFITDMLSASLPFIWAPVRMVSDDPAKVLDRARPGTSLGEQLQEAIGHPSRQMGLVSAYFVPTAAGVEAFAALSRENIEVSVLTNALESTDVAIVHAGYAKRRQALIRAGVRLFEMRRLRVGTRRKRRLPLGVGGSGAKSVTGSILRSSGSTLHAKTFTVDRARLFVGSFNFDPRSVALNTELGFVIECPELAADVQDAFKSAIPMSAYEVTLSDKGRLRWIEREEDGEIEIHDVEPGTTLLQRLAIRVLSRLPIEWLL
jgi:putative cardiolipin synthase